MPRRTLRLLLAALATASLLSACTSPTAPNGSTARQGVYVGSNT